MKKNMTNTGLSEKPNTHSVSNLDIEAGERIQRLSSCKQLRELVGAQLEVDDALKTIGKVSDVVSTPDEQEGWGEHIGNIASDIIIVVERLIGRVVYDELFLIYDSEQALSQK